MKTESGRAIMGPILAWARDAMAQFEQGDPAGADVLGRLLAAGAVTFAIRIDDVLGQHPVLEILARGDGGEILIGSERLDRADAGKPN